MAENEILEVLRRCVVGKTIVRLTSHGNTFTGKVHRLESRGVDSDLVIDKGNDDLQGFWFRQIENIEIV